MEITIIETSAYLELKRQLSMLSVQLGKHSINSPFHSKNVILLL